jgi:hypothetical protein
LGCLTRMSSLFLRYGGSSCANLAIRSSFLSKLQGYRVAKMLFL